MIIRTATPQDAAAITGIYNHYVEHAHATLEYGTVEIDFFVNKIEDILQSGHHWLVAESEAGIQGYAYSRRWNVRDGYEQTCEVSVYLAQEAQSKGIASLLYGKLFESLREDGMHSVIAVICLPNESSVRLHEKFGMTKTAHFREMGIKFGKWVDVGYWYRNL